MPVTKTWLVNNPKPRPSHASLNGETVPINEPFSNGMMFPGDSADAAEVANCTCTVAIDGKAAVADLPDVQPVGASPELTPYHMLRMQNVAEDQLQEVVSHTGLESRWTGELRVGDAVDSVRVVDGTAAGVKNWDCSISLSAQRVAGDDVALQKTVIHEIAHSVSVDAGDKAIYKAWRPYEEGVVEGYARSLLESQGTRVTSEAKSYSRWVDPLDKAWSELYATDGFNLKKVDWYRELLRTPMAEREAFINNRLEAAGLRMRVRLR